MTKQNFTSQLIHIKDNVCLTEVEPHLVLLFILSVKIRYIIPTEERYVLAEKNSLTSIIIVMQIHKYFRKQL